MQAAKQAEAFDLIHPHDRNGKAIADRHCTQEVEKALNDYRFACDAARAAVRNQLRQLADTLQVRPYCMCCAVLCCAVLCCGVPHKISGLADLLASMVAAYTAALQASTLNAKKCLVIGFL